MTEVEKSKLTQQFLQCIAQHLSSRPECKGITYRIAIDAYDTKLIDSKPILENDLSGSRILFSPNVLVFPDRYQRKEINKVNVVHHVICSHFGELLIDDEEIGLFVDSSKLVKGIYEYQSSMDNKKRRWVRIESL